MKKSYLYIIGLGVAVGVAYYFYNKSKNPTTKPANPAPNEKSATEEKSNLQGKNRGGNNKAGVGVYCGDAVTPKSWMSQADCDKLRGK